MMAENTASLLLREAEGRVQHLKNQVLKSTELNKEVENRVKSQVGEQAHLFCQILEEKYGRVQTELEERRKERLAEANSLEQEIQGAQKLFNTINEVCAKYPKTQKDQLIQAIEPMKKSIEEKLKRLEASVEQVDIVPTPEFKKLLEMNGPLFEIVGASAIEQTCPFESCPADADVGWKEKEATDMRMEEIRPEPIKHSSLAESLSPASADTAFVPAAGTGVGGSVIPPRYSRPIQQWMKQEGRRRRAKSLQNLYLSYQSRQISAENIATERGEEKAEIVKKGTSVIEEDFKAMFRKY